jgi:hypothetical protein
MRHASLCLFLPSVSPLTLSSALGTRVSPRAMVHWGLRVTYSSCEVAPT